jgi:hypothetical protein
MLIEITTSLILSAGAQRCGSGERMLSITSGKARSIAVCGPAVSGPLYSESVETALAKDLAHVPGVNRIFVEHADGNLLVWIAADNPSRAVRESIFQKQFDIIDAFPEVSFDFNIISTHTDVPVEIASEAKLIYSR